MVIRTLSDYSSNDNSGGGNTTGGSGGRTLGSGGATAMPVPSQWQQQEQGSGGTWADLQDGNQPQQQSMMQQPLQQEGMFWSWNLTSPPQWYHMVLLCCCPCFVGPPCSDVRKQDYKRMLKTFLFWATIAEIIYFIVEISYGGVTSTSVNPSIGPPTSALRKLGAKSAYDIKRRYQIFRLVTAIFMHAGFIHLFMNLYVQFMIGLGFEKGWGWWRTTIIYFVTGIAGNIFSCCVKPNAISVGASGALCGIIGARISDVALRWKKMNQQTRISNGISIAILVFFTMMMSFTSSYVDWASHLGGLITGIMIGLALFAHEFEDKRYRSISIMLGVGLTVVFYLATGLSFIFAVKVN